MKVVHLKHVIKSVIVFFTYASIHSCNSGTNLALSSATSASTTLSATSLSPLAAKPGELVTLSGSGFNPKQEVSIVLTGLDNESKTTSAKIMNSKEISFTMPDGLGMGLKAVAVKVDGKNLKESLRIVANSEDNELPIYVGEASEVCSTLQYIDKNGDTQTGTKDCSGTAVAECSADGAIGCKTTASFPAASAALAIAGNIKSGVTIAGVAGSATLAPANCSSNAAIGCVTTSTYKSADLTNLTEGNIKNGVTIAGVAGLYPNSTYTLPSASGTADLDAATFDAKVKSATAFEYWDSSGTRQAGAGDADITAGNIASGVSIFGTSGSVTPGTAPNAWDVRAGTVVNGVTGKLKVNCRNTATSSIYNYDGAVGSLGTGSVATGTTVDIWDTIEDYNSAGTSPLLPASTVSGWSAATNCGGIESTSGDDNVWKDVTTTAGGAASTCAADSARCTYQDKISGLWWSKLQSIGQAWNTAVQTCDGLDFNGQTDWRLPTQKELIAAYDHGIRATQSAHFVSNFAANAFWSASTRSSGTANAWYVSLSFGDGATLNKTSSLYVVCVR